MTKCEECNCEGEHGTICRICSAPIRGTLTETRRCDGCGAECKLPWCGVDTYCPHGQTDEYGKLVKTEWRQIE